jgi:hypothetical protein
MGIEFPKSGLLRLEFTDAMSGEVIRSVQTGLDVLSDESYQRLLEKVQDLKKVCSPCLDGARYILTVDGREIYKTNNVPPYEQPQARRVMDFIQTLTV